MKNIIIYATKHGCTEKCAQKLRQKLHGETYAINIKNSGNIDLTDFDTVVLGGSIHAGRIQKSLVNFCNNNENILLNKNIGVFICCMEHGGKAEKQFNEAFPENLRNHASAGGIFGGEFNFEKMNFIEKFIVRKVAKVENGVSEISEESISLFAEQLNNYSV